MAYTDTLHLLKPTNFVNDENINIPLKELQDNFKYILNYLNGNKLLIPALYGNLLDFNDSGKRVFYNGGRFDSIKKCNSWTSLSSYAVTNDEEITFDSVSEMLVYKGRSSRTDSREKWIEREIYIPEILRNQDLILSIKATGSTTETYSESTSNSETIGIQLLGGLRDVNEFAVVGPWDNFDYFTNSQNVPKIITHHIPFTTAHNTKSIKIKILRTINTNYLLINKIFLGGMTLPYSGYILNNIDINELYDFEKAISKIHSTSVMGHKVAESYELAKGSDLVTVELLAKILQQCMCTTPATSGTSGTSGSP